MDKLCETINRQCCLHCEMECDGKWLKTEIEMYKEDLLKKQSDKIADLESKLAESESESNARYSAWQEEIGECDRLRVALAEKEKEIERLKIYDEYRFEMPYPKVKILGKTLEDIQEIIDKWLEQGGENKIKFAVAELEGLKDFIIKNNEPTRKITEITRVINQKIRTLKGEK